MIIFHYHSSQCIEIINHHVEIFVFIQIIDLEEILLLQTVACARLQIELDVFSLFEGSLECADFLDWAGVQTVDQRAKNRPVNY